MTITSIFSSKLPGDVDPIIFSFCSSDRLFNLIYVNKQANNIISSGKFFELCFYSEHPYLNDPKDPESLKIKKICILLNDSHPDKFWKVLCRTLDLDFQDFPVSFNEDFFTEARDLMYKGEMPQIKTLKCAYQEKQSTIRELENQIEMSQNKESNQNEQSNIDSLKEELHNHKLLAINTQKQIAINSDPNNFSELGHGLVVNNEIINLKDYENELASKSRLLECLHLISELIKYPEEKTPDALNRVRNLIESFIDWKSATSHSEQSDSDIDEQSESEDDLRTIIWMDLYEKCGQGSTEDSWSENHFQDFLPELNAIIVEQLALTNGRIRALSENAN
jgi:hypothetical protein